jgi:2-polyprenyl-3-methyl-5-hydroxy-6-metoxy-1,4-benzoquinol methylase
MEKTVKDNVAAFDYDVRENGGYRYTSNASFSSIVSNKRLTDKTEEVIRSMGGAIKTILDIGCGDGTFTQELAQKIPGVSFVGFDPASEAIALAQRQFPSCSFEVGNILEDTPSSVKQYDLAIMRGVLHHLSSQKPAIENAMKYSKRLLIIEPNGNNPILKIIERSSEYHVKHEEQSFSSRFFLNIAAELKLQVKSLSFVGFVPFFFPDLPAKIIYYFQPLLERIPFLGRFFGGQIVLLLERE